MSVRASVNVGQGRTRSANVGRHYGGGAFIIKALIDMVKNDASAIEVSNVSMRTVGQAIL